MAPEASRVDNRRILWPGHCGAAGEYPGKNHRGSGRGPSHGAPAFSTVINISVKATMNYFKAAPIAALILFGSLAGCSSEVARPMTVTCGMPRQQFVQRVSDVLISNGNQITSASVDNGSVQAMASVGASGMEYQRRIWTVQSSGSDMIVNASVVSKEVGGSESVRFVDDSHMNPGDAAWFQPVMSGLRSICANPGSAPPSNPGTIESTPRR